MKILLTNDDGIHAAGLLALHRALSTDNEVFVVAPEYEQSAVGHAITLADPIKVKEVRKNGTLFGYALSGTPADCVRLGVGALMPGRPDMVVSGINRGANVGINILYSGTVSAATEAGILGITAAAVSLNTFAEPDYGPAAEISRGILPQLAVLSPDAGVSFNVNVPALPLDRIKGVTWARQCLSAPGEVFTRRVDPRGNVYYWRGQEVKPRHVPADSDMAQLARGYVTVSPLYYDLTNHDEFTRLLSQDIELKSEC